MGDRSSDPAWTIVGPQPSAPHAAGAASEDTKGLNAARPDDLPAALLYGGTGKRGRAAASLLCCLGITPFKGRKRSARYLQCGLRLTGRLGRRDGREAQLTGRPTGRPSFCRRAGGVGWRHEGSGEAEEARQEGRAEVAQGETGGEARQEARQQLHRLATAAARRALRARPSSGRRPPRGRSRLPRGSSRSVARPGRSTPKAARARSPAG